MITTTCKRGVLLTTFTSIYRKYYFMCENCQAIIASISNVHCCVRYYNNKNNKKPLQLHKFVTFILHNYEQLIKWKLFFGSYVGTGGLKRRK